MSICTSTEYFQTSPEDGLFRALFDSDDAVFLYYLDAEGLPGNLGTINQAACRLLECSREEFLSASGSSFVQIRDMLRPPHLLKRLYEHRHIRFESEIVTAAGSHIPVEVTAVLFSYLGQPASLITCRRDLITTQTAELKEAHEQLQRELVERLIVNAALYESEEQLRTLINAMPDIVCFKDSDSRWLEANQFTLELYGLVDKPYKGKNDKELAQLSPVYRNALEKWISTDHTAWSSGSAISYEEAITGRDGQTKFFEYIKIPIYYPGGARKGLVVVGRDITARKLAEETQKELDAERIRLERLNLVGEMAVNIGHEIRNPMTTVRGYLQILKQKTELTKYHSWFDFMITDLDEANSIITNFISLAKNKAICLRPCNLNEIIMAILPAIVDRAAVDKKHVNAFLEEIPSLLLDRKEIEKFILNLVENALYVTAANDAVVIQTHLTSSGVILSVADKGPGIPTHLLDKLGTPFFSTKEDNAGLGLAVCYHIASRHKANISVDTDNSGTTMSICFKEFE